VSLGVQAIYNEFDYGHLERAYPERSYTKPAYTEEQVKEMAEKLDFNWEDALFIDPKKIIENYGYDVSNFRYFTFDKCE
jgi:hypothetical protein